MPRLGSESNSSVRRHNPTQTLSNYFQVNSQVWQIRSSGPTRPEADTRGEPSSSDAPDPQLDILDDLLSRTRASGSRTRWNARPFGSPYGHRPLHKWLPSEQKHFEELSALMEMFPEPGSDDESEGEEKDMHDLVAEEMDDEEADEEDADEEELEEDDGSEDEEADTVQTTLSSPSNQSHPPPSSAAAAKKREKNKRKKAKARAKAKEKMKPPPLSDPARDAPQDLLVSMSRIAQLVGSLNTDSPDESNELLQRVREAFTEEGRRQLGSLKPTEPAQWRAEVLQSVRRMESMLGQMEKWQAQVAPGEIEALRAETARLEVRVRAVVEQKERERAEVRATVQSKQAGGAQAGKVAKGPAKMRNEVEVEVAEAGASSEGEDPVVLDGGGLFEPGAREQDDDADSVSDSVPESNSCPSESDTGPTELDPDDHPSLQEPEDKSVEETVHTAVPTAPPPTLPVPAPVRVVHTPLYGRPPGPVSAPTTSATPQPNPSSATAPVPAQQTPNSTLSSTNQNIPPEPPAEPVAYLEKHPWSMTEVLFLLEVVAHFPPAEHGWVFIAEAYNNILITRPLQEWFGKQATASNDEEAKMKVVLQKMHAETRQLRARRAHDERGKAAPFGSAEARAEAIARARLPQGAPTPATMDKDALIVTRLPFPFPTRGQSQISDNPAAPPPAQRIVPFPRRRPPLSLPSEDARAFARVMASAAAGVRPPSAESRAAMLALYSATKARFPVRTAWDCWHRWSTPWVIQPPASPLSTGNGGGGEDASPRVLDYVVGNVAFPMGTWAAQAQAHEFEYRPVPGTYPSARGVQRVVVEASGYDPRPGMVTFARIAHLFAEGAWARIGLRRRPDRTVAEEVLVGRRAKMPATLAGIWPGKAQPIKTGANARTAAQSAAVHPLPPAPPVSVPAPAPIPGPTPTPTDASNKRVRFAPLPSKASPANKAKASPAKQPVVPTTVPASAPTAAPAPLPSTTTHPRPPFRPIPTPRAPPPKELPRVPEGTLGNRVRPGMAAWFECAAVRGSALERVLRVEEARRRFERALSGEGEMAEWKSEAEGEEEVRGSSLPLHLRKLTVPPVGSQVGEHR
ncbi:hypothetical protein C8Q79DRAFT_1014222 [Trametes meyenii]|nr:hypothetical protein C8Q79DRAFT_1014222 [Trametes meyenii]